MIPKRKNKNEEGFTLIEVLVAVGIFVYVVLIATQIFKMTIEAQQKSIASKHLQENIRYCLEAMSKEVRMARPDRDGTCVPEDTVYYTNAGNDELWFLNQYDRCVHYFLDGDRLKINRGGSETYMTPSNLSVGNLEFNVAGSLPNDQILTTIKIISTVSDERLTEQTLRIQTSLSNRHYE